MCKFLTIIKDIFSIKELGARITNTLLFLLLFRAGKFIPLPGVDLNKLSTGSSKGIMSLLDTFLGGAFSSASIFALGVMPYISASIVMQLLTIIFPKFQKIQRDGESGRKRIARITRILTLFLAIIQALSYLITTTMNRDVVIVERSFFLVSSVIILTAGTVFCMWLGERITEKGIGNGVSMLMMIGIISSLPGAISEEIVHRGSRGMLILVIEMLVFFLIIIIVVSFTQATRRVPLKYVKQIVGGSSYGGKRQYIPIKLNNVGVMPIIFAQVFMFFLAFIFNIWAENSTVAAAIGRTLNDYTTWQYHLVHSCLIIAFTFFYTAITINPSKIAEDMKRNNSFVPGVQSGNATAIFFDEVLGKTTFAGALLLAAISILPAFANMLGVSSNFSKFYGGTSLLIMVGVVLETLQQIESYLLMRHYEGIINTGGRIKRNY